MASEALPYLDEYDQSMKVAVAKLIEEEMKTFTFHPPPMKPLPDLSHQRYQSEFDRINRHENPLDMQRYHVDPPPPEKRQDLMAWSKAVENAEVALEHQNKRLMNLFLATKYGPKKAAHYEMEMQAREDRLSKELADLKEEIVRINRERKKSQLAAKPRLDQLEHEFQEGVRANLTIDAACQSLERQLAPLRERLAEHREAEKCAAAAAAAALEEEHRRAQPLPESVARNIEATAAAQAAQREQRAAAAAQLQKEMAEAKAFEEEGDSQFVVDEEEK